MNTVATATLLACPRCERLLHRYSEDSYVCGGCGVRFPSLLGIPCLFSDPLLTLSEWRGRLQLAIEKLAYDAAGVQAELQNPRLRSPTRERLVLLNRAYLDQARRLQELLVPLAIHQAEGTVPAHAALQTRLPTDQGLTTYYANLHRDWCWGDEENEASWRIVSSALGGEGSGVLAILGAGGCRLAYDLHQRGIAERTFAVDFNPLLLLVAQRAMSGQDTTLWEFPVAPRSLADHAVLRSFAAETPVRPGLSLILADVLRPPFAAGSLDTVLTPWLVDILPEDLPVIAARINTLLKPGGRWVSFGSLAFAQPEVASCYSLEETLAIIAEAGFGEPAVREDEIPYMCSPASRHGRRERVVTITAVKQREVVKPPRPRTVPEWLVNGTQPVPLLRSFQMQAASTRIYAYLMSLIDGRRSVRDIAKLLEEQRLMTRSEAEPAVRNFLLKMYDDSRRSGAL